MTEKENKEFLEWHTEKRKINDLLPWDKNPRFMTKKQKEDLTGSLEKLNLIDIPSIDFDGRIIGGHQRCKILQTMGRGDEIIDVRVPNRKLTKEEFIEANIRLNRDNGSWDYAILSTDFELSQLIDWGFDESELMGNFANDQEIDTIKNDLLDNQKEDRADGEIIEKKKKSCPNCGFILS